MVNTNCGRIAHQNAASSKNTYYRNIGHGGAQKQPLAGPVEYLTKGVQQYAGLEDGSVHTLDFFCFFLFGVTRRTQSGAECKFSSRPRFEPQWPL